MSAEDLEIAPIQPAAVDSGAPSSTDVTGSRPAAVVTEEAPILARATTPCERLQALLAGGLGEALWLFITLRFAFSLFGLMASTMFPLPGPCTFASGDRPLDATGLGFRLLGLWQHWDVCWYQHIAMAGYRPGEGSVAFFPLYPLLMRDAGVLLGGDVALGGLIVSGMAYIAAIAGLYLLVRDDFDKRLAQRTVLYISVFPTAFFFFIPYTEALFLALAVWTFYAARRGLWGWAAVCAFLVALTRTQGCLLALPLAWEAFRQWRAGRRSVLALLVPILAVAGLLAFLAYSQIVVGYTTFKAQQAWGLTLHTPWTALGISWSFVRQHGDVVELSNLLWVIVFAALLVYGLRRLPFAYTLYALPQWLVISSRQMFLTPMMSTGRFVLVLFPAFILLAMLGRRERVHYSWLIVSLLLLGFLLYTYLSGPFVA